MFSTIHELLFCLGIHFKRSGAGEVSSTFFTRIETIGHGDCLPQYREEKSKPVRKYFVITDDTDEATQTSNEVI